MTEQTTESHPMIVARDVHKWYGHFHALRGINMTVEKGEVIVIFGPSGSGKSTFIRTINRLEEHQRGQIFVDGVELTHDVRNVEKIRTETGMVFQQFNLFPHLTVLQNISLAPLHDYGATASLNKALKKIEDGQHEDARVIAAASRVIEAALQLPIERIRTLEHALEVRKF